MIINDSFIKGEKHLFNFEPESESTKLFNCRITAANEFYRYLYERGTLKAKSFEWKEYSDIVYFALDTQQLDPEDIPTPEQIKDFELISENFLNGNPAACHGCGAVEMAWMMLTYRDNDGTVSRSCECELCKYETNDRLYEIREERRKKGTRSAVKMLWNGIEWEEES